MSAGLPNIPVNTIVYTNGSAKDAVYIGCDIGVYYLDNTQGTCTPFSTNLPNAGVRDLEIFYPLGILRAATYGRGSWETVLFEPLPVQIASFTGLFVNNNVQTFSDVQTNRQSYGFYVQGRSNGIVEWSDLPNSFVAGHGTTNEPQNYSFTHANVANGQRQYRLKQVDLDGTVHFTEPITVSSPTSVTEQVPIEFTLKQNYPNPFNPATNIAFSVAQTGRATLEIYNMLGQKLLTLFDDIVEPGQYKTVRFDGSSFASGLYFYRLQSGNKSDLKKLLLLK